MFLSHVVRVGGLKLGGEYPVRLQSMTRNDTRDVQATTAECIRAFEAGADMMRISVPDHASVKGLRQIKLKLKQSGFLQPLIADIHYHPELALRAARIAGKIRINPGNFGSAQTREPDESACHHPARWKETLHQNLRPLTDICKEHDTAIRIGINYGSLPLYILKQHGQSNEAMVETGIEYLKILESLGFFKTIISLKTSSPKSMVMACRMMASRMLTESMSYPMHIGVTEAGIGISGRVKSALGILSLLHSGIGDTIRVSLTETPEKEIEFAKRLKALAAMENKQSHELAGLSGTTLTIHSEASETDNLIADAVNQYVQFGEKEMVREIIIDAPQVLEQNVALETAVQLTQAAGIYACETEFISCPACARVSMDMEQITKEVKKRLSGRPGLKIAIMGCMVNGPGEMADADYGLICTRSGLLHLYKGKQRLKKKLAQKAAIKLLEQLVEDPVADI